LESTAGQLSTRVFAEHEIAAVMHLAAASLVGESMVDPQKYYATNVACTLCLLDAMRIARCQRLEFSSNGPVYGQADSKALPEDYPYVPINVWRVEMDDRAHARVTEKAATRQQQLVIRWCRLVPRG